jgi:hypothetical protein
MRNNAHSTVYKDESRLFYAALVTFAAVFLAYVYFVSVSVADVVMRKEVDEQISGVGTTIGRLEADYIEMQHALSSGAAVHKGFVAVDTKIFIDTAEDTLVLHSN